MAKDLKYRKLFLDFDRQHVMIIGDVMLDSYLWGKVERISPEAPIPIVVLRSRENRMGGAANVARNIKALGANPILCSVIGNDEKGNQFLDLLKQEKIENRGIIRSDQRVTTTKFRIFGNNYQMLRVDEEVDHDLSEEDHRKVWCVIQEILREGDVHCIVFQELFDEAIEKIHLFIDRQGLLLLQLRLKKHDDDTIIIRLLPLPTRLLPVQIRSGQLSRWHH